uniref:exodeoxyribonuclease III n=1 Tax=Globodera pallida TaxID=36090 RepID=A0A183BLU2_GLOPA
MRRHSTANWNRLQLRGSAKRNYPLFEKGKETEQAAKKKKSTEPLKIWSWNVAGLRACVKRGGHQLIRESNADIVSLQETKCAEFPNEINALDEYKYKKLLVSKQSKGGYAGVALLSKEKPVRVDVGIGDADFDEQARYIQAEYPNFFFVVVYVTNAGQKLVNLQKRARFDELLLEKLTALDQRKPVVIGGDMNVAHQEIDLRNPDTNRNKTAGFTDQERDAFTRLLDAGFVDVWRARNPETTGAYTYWSYIGNRFSNNIGWRLDYFVVSQRVFDDVNDCDILKEIRCSDHCPISMRIKFE